MKLRAFKDSDYESVVSWWEHHGCAVIPKEALPKNGLMVESDDGLVSCSWLCVDGSLAYIGWIVSNPSASPFSSYRAVITMISEYVDFADTNNLTMTANTASSGLCKIYKRLGFSVAEEQTTTFVRIV